MNDQIKQIAERLRGLRDVLELTSEDIARDCDISAEEYRLAETGQYDNYPYAPLITPSLTVVDIDMYSLGTRAGASLLKKIQNPEMLIQTYTALPHLIQRDSTVLHSET